MAESASEAMGRATQVMVDAIHAEQDRLVAERIVARDERGRPRTREQVQARAALAAVTDAAADAWLKTADQLEPGEFVRVLGEHYRFGGLLPDGRMRLFVGDHEFHYGPTEGERFVWHEGPF